MIICQCFFNLRDCTFNFPVWTYSIIMSHCYYKCNKRNLPLIKAMLCRIWNYFWFMEHTSSCSDVLLLVCNWWWKLFTTIPKRTQTFRRCLPTSINRIWVFYDVLHALFPNKCLGICPFRMLICTISSRYQSGTVFAFLIFVELFSCRDKGFIFFAWI